MRFRTSEIVSNLKTLAIVVGTGYVAYNAAIKAIEFVTTCFDEEDKEEDRPITRITSEMIKSRSPRKSILKSPKSAPSTTSNGKCVAFYPEPVILTTPVPFTQGSSSSISPSSNSNR